MFLHSFSSWENSNTSPTVLLRLFQKALISNKLPLLLVFSIHFTFLEIILPISNWVFWEYLVVLTFSKHLHLLAHHQITFIIVFLVSFWFISPALGVLATYLQSFCSRNFSNTSLWNFYDFPNMCFLVQTTRRKHLENNAQCSFQQRAFVVIVLRRFSLTFLANETCKFQTESSGNLSFCSRNFSNMLLVELLRLSKHVSSFSSNKKKTCLEKMNSVVSRCAFVVMVFRRFPLIFLANEACKYQTKSSGNLTYIQIVVSKW